MTISRLARVLLSSAAALALYSQSLRAAQTNDPGLPAHCWEKPRIVHAGVDYSAQLQQNLQLERVGPRPLERVEYSPNGAYRFGLETQADEKRILIDAEHSELLQVRVQHSMALDPPRWINEKLLYLRIWWGRIAITDLIVDVEAGSIIHTEHATDGHIVFQQARDSCAVTQCEPCPGSSRWSVLSRQ